MRQHRQFPPVRHGLCPPGRRLPASFLVGMRGRADGRRAALESRLRRVSRLRGAGISRAEQGRGRSRFRARCAGRARRRAGGGRAGFARGVRGRQRARDGTSRSAAAWNSEQRARGEERARLRARGAGRRRSAGARSGVRSVRQQPPDGDEMLLIVGRLEAADGDVLAARRCMYEEPVAEVNADVR